MSAEVAMLNLPGDPPLPCAIARPVAEGDWPGVIVIMEVFGLNAHIRAVVGRLAQEGFIAIAPDLYCREGEGSVAGYGEAERARAMRGRLSDAQALADLGRCARYLIESDLVRRPEVATLGFCMGGRLSFLAACDNAQPFGRAVCYYGVGIGAEGPPTGEGMLYAPREAGNLRRPVLCHYGAEDPLIGPEEIGRVARVLAVAKAEGQICLYPGAGHAFGNEERPANYHPEAAALAWGRTVEFLRAR